MNNNKKPQICKYCNATINSIESLITHVINSHKEIHSLNYSILENNIWRRECSCKEMLFQRKSFDKNEYIPFAWDKVFRNHIRKSLGLIRDRPETKNVKTQYKLRTRNGIRKYYKNYSYQG